MSPRTADTAVAVHPLLAERWSPRSFDASHTVTDEQLTALLEAARWAASAGNLQPWRFLVGRRGDATFKQIFDSLKPGNQLWAGNSSLLIAAVAAEQHADGTPHSHAAYDTGLAVAQLVLQAQALGLHAHQMGGFEAEQLRTALSVPDGYRPLSVTAIGVAAAADLLPPELHARETAARERRPLTETFYAEGWGTPVRVRQQG
ncbi:nitroreductase family protein [Peterkaempfera griseoplana]|uniref:nitroreductase family protein n=1 Tax=Peterkaempfera griseoplana TaxID=66896 RepID=UPI0006E3D812|nr:nitroreductase family protein [Peterkaempfera griseoplana]